MHTLEQVLVATGILLGIGTLLFLWYVYWP